MLRLQYDFDAAIFSIAKLFVEVRPVLEPTRVSDHEGGIDLALSDALGTPLPFRLTLITSLKNPSRDPA